jgi:sugar lactone lactonase YvrE
LTTIIAGNPAADVALAADSSGNVYVSDASQNCIRRLSAAGAVLSTIGCPGDVRATNVRLVNPHGIALDDTGNLFVANSGENAILRITPAGIATAIVHTEFHKHPRLFQAMHEQQLSFPTDVVVNKAGEVYIADTLNHRIRKVAKDGAITTIVGIGTAGFSGDGGPASAAQLNRPYGLALNAAGDLYIADTANNRVRKIWFASSSGATITTVTGNGRYGFSGDGGRATSASITVPRAVAVDQAGNLLIADFDNNRLRRVSPDGIISTVDAVKGVNGIRSLAIDRANNVYLADARNYAIHKLSPAGVMTTMAGARPFGGRIISPYGEPEDGGPAATAWIGSPNAVAADAGGNVYFVDFANNRVRRIWANGIIGTAVGFRGRGFSGDGGPAVRAQIDGPHRDRRRPRWQHLYRGRLQRAHPQSIGDGDHHHGRGHRCRGTFWRRRTGDSRANLSSGDGGFAADRHHSRFSGEHLLRRNVRQQSAAHRAERHHHYGGR